MIIYSCINQQKGYKMFKRISVILVSVLILLTVNGCGKKTDPKEYRDGELKVSPDSSKYMHALAEEGIDIYITGAGYRYGPTIFVNADGSIDAWFASPGGNNQWDWVFYRTSKDGGVTWSKEKVVLQPTPDSMDYYSVCDPGVIKIGEYYYMGYTSTIYEAGICNNVFVARSKNPDGPYEKWNGSGWGGRPVPIVYYNENANMWGAGEPSFVEKDGVLYIYYTWKGMDANGDGTNQTRVAIADATDPNWPATMEYKGIAVNHRSADSMDIKYVEDYGKFIGVTTRHRMSKDSYIPVYESNDGINFYETGSLRTNIAQYCHNVGISSRPNGHIRVSSDDVYVAYGYGDQWAAWNTRMNKVNIQLDDNIDDPDKDGKSVFVPIVFAEPELEVKDPAGITPDYPKYTTYVGNEFKYAMQKHNSYMRAVTFNDKDIKFNISDKSVLKYLGNGMFKALKEGETYITISYKGLYTTGFIRVISDDEYFDKRPVTFDRIVKVLDEHVVSLTQSGRQQIRVIGISSDRSWMEYYGAKQGISDKPHHRYNVYYSGYDENIIEVDSSGNIYPKNEGTTSVTVTIEGVTENIKVIVIP